MPAVARLSEEAVREIVWDLADAYETDEYENILAVVQTGFERSWFMTRAFTVVAGPDAVAIAKLSDGICRAEAIRNFSLSPQFVSLELILRAIQSFDIARDRLSASGSEPSLLKRLTKVLTDVRQGRVFASIYQCDIARLREALGGVGLRTDDEIRALSSEIFRPAGGMPASRIDYGEVLHKMLSVEKYRYCQRMAHVLVDGLNQKAGGNAPAVTVGELFHYAGRTGRGAGRGSCGMPVSDGHKCGPLARTAPHPRATTAG